MDFFIRELILNKDTTAKNLADILLEYDKETTGPILEIIDTEIGNMFDDEPLDIFDWMNNINRNYNMLNSLLFQEEWWIIHKKLRRMVRKYNKKEQEKEVIKLREKRLKQSKEWQFLEPYVRLSLDNKTVEERIRISYALSGSLTKTPGLPFYPEFTTKRKKMNLVYS